MNRAGGRPMSNAQLNRFERLLENGLYLSRWILAPIYLGLSIAALALGVKFFQELIHVALHILERSQLQSWRFPRFTY